MPNYDNELRIVLEQVADEIDDMKDVFGDQLEAVKQAYLSALSEFEPLLDAQIGEWATGSPCAEAQVKAMIGQMQARFARISLAAADAVRDETRKRVVNAIRITLSVIFKLIAV